MCQKRILLVEDDPDDRDLTLRALQKARVPCAVDVVRDGAEMVDYLFCTGVYRDRATSPRPDVILLDLKMPKLSGLQVLQVLRRAHRQDAELLPPVVVLTSSDQADDIHESYRLGAHGYVCKPIDFSQFIDAIEQLAIYWLHVNRPPPRMIGSESRFVTPSTGGRG